MRVVLIGGRKATDAALARALERVCDRITVVHYRIPISNWLPWIVYLIQLQGVTVLMGHVLLGISLRSQRLVERVRSKSLWLKFRDRAPSWRDVHAKQISCHTERSLIRIAQDADIVVLLDAYRLSRRFYRALRGPCLQIVWGLVPDYAGDSGAFWAYAQGDWAHVGASVVIRKANFSASRVVSRMITQVDAHENIRTIKIRLVTLLEQELPQVIQKLSLGQLTPQENKRQPFRIFRAPTLWTYLEFLRHRKISFLPHYAFKKI